MSNIVKLKDDLKQEKNVLMANIIGNIYSTGTELDITGWQVDYKKGNRLSAVSEGVKIGEGITTVKVSGSFFYRHVRSAGNVAPLIRVYKNNDPIITLPQKKTVDTDDTLTFSISPFLLDVTENDIIKIQIRGIGAGDYIAGYDSTTGDRTYLTVEAVE